MKMLNFKGGCWRNMMLFRHTRKHELRVLILGVESKLSSSFLPVLFKLVNIILYQCQEYISYFIKVIPISGIRLWRSVGKKSPQRDQHSSGFALRWNDCWMIIRFVCKYFPRDYNFGQSFYIKTSIFYPSLVLAFLDLSLPRLDRFYPSLLSILCFTVLEGGGEGYNTKV